MKRTQYDITIETGPVRYYSVITTDDKESAIRFAMREYRKENGFSPSEHDVVVESYAVL